LQAPTPGYREVNYLHTMAADAQGKARAGLINRGLAGGIGLSISFDVKTLPCLSEWKMLSAGDYVVGLEPVNTRIANRSELRAKRLLPMIEPGEVREMDLEVGVLEGAAEIDDFLAEVRRIRESYRA
jgi:hypothetical protein